MFRQPHTPKTGSRDIFNRLALIYARPTRVCDDDVLQALKGFGKDYVHACLKDEEGLYRRWKGPKKH